MTGRRAAVGYVGSARTVYLNTSAPSAQRELTLEAHMFLDDLSNQAVPYRLGRTRTTAVRVTPARSRLRRLVAEVFKPGSWDPDDAVEDFVRECAASLVTNEIVPYEIERLRRPRSKRTSRVTLRSIQPWSVKPARNGLVQQVPADDREMRALVGEVVPATIFLPDAELLCFQLPVKIRRELTDALQALQSIPNLSVPAWLPEEVAKPNGDQVTIDGRELKARRLAAVGAATGRIGWDARGSLQGGVGEYYLLIRQIRWQRFLYHLRSAVLDTLNLSLPRVLAPLQIEATVSSVGLPNLEELQLLEERLQSGATTLGDGYSAISIWRFGRDVHRPATR